MTNRILVINRILCVVHMCSKDIWIDLPFWEWMTVSFLLVFLASLDHYSHNGLWYFEIMKESNTNQSLTYITLNRWIVDSETRSFKNKHFYRFLWPMRKQKYNKYNSNICCLFSRWDEKKKSLSFLRTTVQDLVSSVYRARSINEPTTFVARTR